MTKPTDATRLGLAKLAASGLDANDAKRLGIDILEPNETARLHPAFKPLPALRLAYRDPRDPTKPLTPQPRHPPFYRLRYLAQPAGFTQVTDAKPLRYVQEPGSGVCAYFPANHDWPKTLKDAETPLLITEGELKAAKGCKEDFVTIGLGGVYNFKKTSDGITFLPELEAVNWVRRIVHIVFDSDLKSNPMVAQALNELAQELFERGARPHFLVLPELVEGEKTGLDDFLVSEDPDKLAAMLAKEAEPLTLARPLWELNKKVTYVFNPPVVMVDETMQKMSAQTFKDGFGNKKYHEQVFRPDGTVSLKPVSVAEAWLKWPLRDSAGKLTYAPGQPRRFNGHSVLTSSYNLWPGWGLEPVKGDVKPFLALVRHLFQGAPKEDLDWFLRWLAFPLQHPGVKLATSVLLYGRAHGTGKSLIGYTMKPIYGSNFTSIRQADLESTFNAWADGRQFILVDDITGTTNRQNADVLKKLVTQQEIWINQKNIQQFTVPDCINYMFTSNQPDALFLEDDDRRFFVHEVTVPPLDEEFYVDYDLWLSSGGAAHVFHYLLNLDLGDFQPHAHARRTSAKERMTADAMSDLGSWIRRLKQEPEALLKVGAAPMEGDLFTNRQLLTLYDPAGVSRTTANGLGRELKRAGFYQVLNGQLIKSPDGTVDRWYVIRNLERWQAATLEQVKAHLEPKPGSKRPQRKKF